MNQLILKCQKALITVDKYYDAALQHVRGELIVDGKLFFGQDRMQWFLN